MTQFADDFEITQDQADTLNARIATNKENTMQTTTATAIKFDCIANLIHRYERATQGYYFSNDTMKFFSGKVYEPVYRVGDTEVFVDSIRDTYSNQPRQYRVKEWNGDSGIETVTEYKTLRSAEKAAKKHAEHLANQ